MQDLPQARWCGNDRESKLGSQRNALQAQELQRHGAGGRSMTPSQSCLFMTISLIEVGDASSCDAVRSSCLWAQHATSF
jgi:hypothetical protein